MPFSLKMIQSLKVPMRPSTNYLTTWTLTLTRVSSIEPEIWFLMRTLMLGSIINPRDAADMDPTSYLPKMNQYHAGMGPYLMI